MNPLLVGAIVFASVFGAAMLALVFGALLPKAHLSADSKDTVKLAMGLLATLAALVLGLLVASAKGSYDAEKNEITVMAAKIAFLDRFLAMYGPEAAPQRDSLRRAVESMTYHLWPAAAAQPSQRDPRSAAAEDFYRGIQSLSPQTDEQRLLKAQAIAAAIDVGQTRWLLFAQSGTAISTPLLVIVICWLAILFFSFGLFAPRNGTVIVVLAVTALSVAGAIFLVLELDQPFGGVIQISSQPMVNTLNNLGK